MQPAGVRHAAAGADRATAGGSGPLYRLREQLLSGLAPGRAVPPAWAGPTVAGTALGAAPDGGWPKPGLELGYQLFAHHGAGGVAVPLPGGRRLEPQGGGLGCGRGGVSRDRG